MNRFSIAALAPQSPEYGLGKWNDPHNLTAETVWLVPIPALPEGEYKVVSFNDSQGEACVLIQRVGPPNRTYCK